MIQYPEGLPLPQRAGYELQPVSPMKRTPNMAGRARQRPNKRSTPVELPLTWKFNNVQAQLFESWWEEVLVSGTAWFEMRLKTPQGLQPYKCRFMDVCSGGKLEGVSRWEYTAPIEMYKRPILLGGWALYAPQFMLYMKEIDIVCTRTWPEAPDE
ncbi:hypothetical protein [Halopseudomonas laoshanensis]|uniref:hypothetical protein n=1 Tax=Halopseudomonas laoshanensis TaxID=2268758 RepID=UPI00373694F2